MSFFSENRARMKRHLRVVPPLTHDELRPKTRAECVDGPRPCPWIACRHHLAIDVDALNGTIRFTYPEAAEGELEAREHTCSLDVADRGEHTLQEVGEILILSRERVRQLEEVILARAEKKMRRYR